METTPPIGQYIVSAYASIVFVAVFCMYQFMDGIAPLLISFFLAGSVLVADHFLTPTVAKNMEVLKRNGYSRSQVFISYTFVTVLAFTSTFLFINLLTKGIDTSFNLKTVGLILLNLVGSDVIYTPVHKALHEKFPKLHHMHHCTIYPSVSSSFVFQFNDLLIEFTPPFVAPLIFHFVFQDKLASFLSVSLIHWWYIMDHDSTIKFGHYYHHKNTNSDYPAYAIGWLLDRKPNKADTLKRLVIRTGKAEPVNDS